MKMVKKAGTPFFNRFNFKIGMVGLISALIGLFMTMAVSYYGIKQLSQASSKEIQKGLTEVTQEYTENYLNMTSSMIETKISRYFDEQAILADMYQKYIDSIGKSGKLVDIISSLPDIKDDLKFNGRWYQNSNDEQSVVLVPRYLLDKNGKIKSNVSTQIKQSTILDWLMPSIHKNGAEKLWIYFEGGRDASFMRIAPWNDAGSSMDKIYPSFTDKEMWDDFNPGLVDSWEKKIREDKEMNKDLSSYAIVKSPTQDGGTGKIIMTLDYPIWNSERNKFIGAICLDVELDNIIKYIEDVKLAKTGFAFLTQSNGNVFAINENGINLLGLKNAKDATAKDSSGTGYNRMQRFFSDSIYRSVGSIKLPAGDSVVQSEIKINGKDYILIQKNLKALNSWNKENGFFNESWSLGFVVPKDEVYSAYIASQNKINDSKSHVLFLQFIIAIITIIIIGVGIYFGSKGITRNLRKLELAAVNITNKDYDFKIDVISNDEIGKLAETMNTMKKEIKSSFEQLNIQNELLKKEISEKEARGKKIKYLEEHDILTNLPNQKLLNKIIKEKVSKHEPPENIVVALIGIDNFRNVNEAFGPSIGDDVLRFLAKRLEFFLKDTGVVARVNGDEFAMVFYNTQSVEDIAQRIEGIMNTIKQGFTIEDKRIYLTACIGVSSYPNDTDNVGDLIRLSSSALVHAKEKGSGSYQFYSSLMNENAKKRITMITELRNAVKRNEFQLYYQPQIDLKDKNYVGVEALIRWKNETLGMVMPSVFIPLAEETGLIFEIGEWVLKTACLQARKWYDSGYSNLKIGVNVSPVQFRDDKLVESIKFILAETGLPPELLELEVTESIFIDDTKSAVDKLSQLRNLGVKIAVDDFGTGYSSLSYIKDLPIDKLKIDRSFIKEIPDQDNGTIANIIINLAHSLNIGVTAEGVETTDQEQFLVEKCCSEAQGYYYSRPIPADELMKKLNIK